MLCEIDKCKSDKYVMLSLKNICAFLEMYAKPDDIYNIIFDLLKKNLKKIVINIVRLMRLNIEELNEDPDINLCDRLARSKGIKYYYEVKRKNIEYWRAREVLI